MDQRIRDKTEFPLHHRLYRYIRMPYRLESTLKASQIVMDVTLAFARWEFSLIHLDDTPSFRARLMTKSRRFGA